MKRTNGSGRQRTNEGVRTRRNSLLHPTVTYLDVLGPVRVLERVVGVVEEDVRRIHVGDHHQPAAPLQRGLEQVGQLAVAVLDVAGALPRRESGSGHGRGRTREKAKTFKRLGCCLPGRTRHRKGEDLYHGAEIKFNCHCHVVGVHRASATPGTMSATTGGAGSSQALSLRCCSAGETTEPEGRTSSRNGGGSGRVRLALPPRRRRLPASALMQLARDRRDLLMLAPCRSCSPRLFVAEARSELRTKE